MGRVSDAKQRLMDAVLELIWTGSYGNTTIDHICDKAGVKKGSFYYFFESKADLAAAAFEANWQIKKAELDAMFSPTIPPLERLQKYCDFS
jgi:TetR/AcrR family transcriptional repressor of nem operon